MKTYTFSYHQKHRVPILKRRPWWNLFGKDSIVMEDAWTRPVIADIPQDEADLIINASNNHWNTAAGRLLVRLLGTISMVQLETAHCANAYVSTSARCVKNRVYDSLDGEQK